MRDLIERATSDPADDAVVAIPADDGRTVLAPHQDCEETEAGIGITGHEWLVSTVSIHPEEVR